MEVDEILQKECMLIKTRREEVAASCLLFSEARLRARDGRSCLILIYIPSFRAGAEEGVIKREGEGRGKGRGREK